jgi:hypothetical protein
MLPGLTPRFHGFDLFSGRFEARKQAKMHPVTEIGARRLQAPEKSPKVDK